MNRVKNKTTVKILALAIGVTIASCPFAVSAAGAVSVSVNDIPQQIGLALTTEPQTSINITWTTLNSGLINPQAIVWQSNKNESSAIEFTASVETRTVKDSAILDENGQTITNKTFYAVEVTGLKADTKYSYRIGSGEAMTDVRSFMTAPENNGQYTFIYISDPQLKSGSSLAWQVNLEKAEQTVSDAEFIYIAGDLTDKAQNEGQWEAFYNQEGSQYFNSNYQGNLISDLPVTATMGNHDSTSGGAGGMTSHYLWDSEVAGVPVSYAFDYGAARIIILNLENMYSKDSESLRNKQLAFLTEEVAGAQADGKWTIVGFHKSIYSGANHMDDSDVIFNRGFWAPQFAALNIDVVLQGHDHVLSRGFVSADGSKVDVTRQINDRTYIAGDPENAPLYYVGNCGSALKFYAPILNNDFIMNGDPVAFNFGYLDINSALPTDYIGTDGDLLNPGPTTNDDLEGVDPDFFRTPTFTSITVTNGYIEFNTYMTGYNPYTNEIVKDTFLYDSLKVTR